MVDIQDAKTDWLCLAPHIHTNLVRRHRLQAQHVHEDGERRVRVLDFQELRRLKSRVASDEATMLCPRRAHDLADLLGAKCRRERDAGRTPPCA